MVAGMGKRSAFWTTDAPAAAREFWSTSASASIRPSSSFAFSFALQAEHVP